MRNDYYSEHSGSPDMKKVSYALIVLLLSLTAGLSLRMGAQKPSSSSVSVSLNFIIDHKYSETHIHVKVVGETIVSSVKSLLGEKAEVFLSKEAGVPKEFVKASFREKEAEISLEIVGCPPPNDGINFVIQSDVGEVVSAFLEKLGLSGVPVNLSILISLPKGAEVKELEVSPRSSFNAQVEGCSIIISSKSPLSMSKGSLSLYIRYSMPGSKRIPGE